jgi:4-diphosphocytidyl-2-C-methyl-D-erythritol kinase
MSYYEIKSYAKINLALNVTGKTKSLHKIESIVAFVDLHDVILIKKIKSKKHIISFNGKFSKKIGTSNTINKLFTILDKKKMLKNQKFKVKIKKNIPIKAGLGGGSMNAASILSYFVKKKFIKIDKKKIAEISKLIGSDVILGIHPTHSILTNKNEIKRFYNYKKLYTLICKPNFGCSTNDIYSSVRSFKTSKLSHPNKKMFNLNFLKKMDNSLEPIAFSKHPKLKKIKLYLDGFCNPIFVRMSGSGSALVAYFQSKERCDYAKKQFNRKYKNYWCIASKTI